MRYILKIIVAVVFTIGMCTTFAGSGNSQNYLQRLNDVFATNAGMAFLQDGENLYIAVDQIDLLTSLPFLQKEVLFINRDITHTFACNHPVLVCACAAQSFSAFIIYHIFKNTKVNNLHVTTILLTYDYYGKCHKHVIFTFNFNRELYEKINWNKFLPDNIDVVSYGFKFSKWYWDSIKTEPYLQAKYNG